MKKLLFYTIILSLIIAPNSYSHDAVIGKIRIENAWIRMPPNNSTTTAGYLTIYNLGEHTDTLNGVSTTFAKKLELHEMTLNNGIMKMRPLESGIQIPPNSSVVLKPGADHIMFKNLSESLQIGQSIPVTLSFKVGGEVEVLFDVAKIGAIEAPEVHDHGN